MYDDISYVFMNKDSPWTLSMMCISKYVTCLWDYALYDDCHKRSLVESVVWTSLQKKDTSVTFWAKRIFFLSYI